MELVNIIDYDHQGRGIGKINGKIVFVPNTIPGEIVEVNIKMVKKSFMEAEVTYFHKKSDIRIEDICPHYPECGGCQLLHIPYKEQLKYKQDKIKNILDRHNLKIHVTDILTSNKQFNYRNKAKLHVENNTLGFYQEKTKSIIEIDNCLLLGNKINDHLKSLSSDSEIVVRTNGHDISTDNNLIHKIGDFKFQASLNSFLQTNDSATNILYNKILEYLEPSKNDIILDLYCGVGSIGIFISQYVKQVIGIEINEQAVIDANINKDLNNILNIEFICGDVYRKCRELETSFNSIIVDPPRSGLDKPTVDMLIHLNPDKIIYVSCDPLTLTRDLALLQDNYNIEEITPIDMFPNTYHVETIAKLKNKFN